VAGCTDHSDDERIRVQSLLDGRRFLYEIVRMYAQQPD
jgi:acetylornithine deacetylase/succinyl-diaminopimelate desuccinylase-like protein